MVPFLKELVQFNIIMCTHQETLTVIQNSSLNLEVTVIRFVQLRASFSSFFRSKICNSLHQHLQEESHFLLPGCSKILSSKAHHVLLDCKWNEGGLWCLGNKLTSWSCVADDSHPRVHGDCLKQSCRPIVCVPWCFTHCFCSPANLVWKSAMLLKIQYHNYSWTYTLNTQRHAIRHIVEGVPCKARGEEGQSHLQNRVSIHAVGSLVFVGTLLGMC